MDQNLYTAAAEDARRYINRELREQAADAERSPRQEWRSLWRRARVHGLADDTLNAIAVGLLDARNGGAL